MLNHVIGIQRLNTLRLSAVNENGVSALFSGVSLCWKYKGETIFDVGLKWYIYIFVELTLKPSLLVYIINILVDVTTWMTLSGITHQHFIN